MISFTQRRSTSLTPRSRFKSMLMLRFAVPCWAVARHAVWFGVARDTSGRGGSI
jgi:hypothetical protein